VAPPKLDDRSAGPTQSTSGGTTRWITSSRWGFRWPHAGTVTRPRTVVTPRPRRCPEVRETHAPPVPRISRERCRTGWYGVIRTPPLTCRDASLVSAGIRLERIRNAEVVGSIPITSTRGRQCRAGSADPAGPVLVLHPSVRPARTRGRR
jgi:hypothetical protein